MKGVPLRLEIGPRDIENGVVTVVRRDNGEKSVVKNEELEGVIKRLLSDVHESMYRKAEAFRDSRIKEAHTLDELKKYLDEGNFVKAMWCGSQECELKVKELMQATIRIMPFDQTPIDDKCHSGRLARKETRNFRKGLLSRNRFFKRKGFMLFKRQKKKKNAVRDSADAFSVNISGVNLLF